MLEIVACSHLRGERAATREAWDFRISARGLDSQVCTLWRAEAWDVCDGFGHALSDAQIAARLGIDAAQASEARAECAKLAEREYLRRDPPHLRAVA